MSKQKRPRMPRPLGSVNAANQPYRQTLHSAPSCMGKMPNKKRQAKTPARVSLPLSPTAVIVEFKNHPDILEQVTREAKEQIRTISAQIIWTIKNAAPPQGERSHHVQDL